MRDLFAEALAEVDAPDWRIAPLAVERATLNYLWAVGQGYSGRRLDALHYAIIQADPIKKTFGKKKGKKGTQRQKPRAVNRQWAYRDTPLDKDPTRRRRRRWKKKPRRY